MSLPKDVQTLPKPTSIISKYDKCFHVDLKVSDARKVKLWHFSGESMETWRTHCGCFNQKVGGHISRCDLGSPWNDDSAQYVQH
jgi:hypothetical protein